MVETYVALLRAVNVGGVVVDIAALRSMLEELGYLRVRSWLGTGNLLFDAPRTEAPRLESRLAGETARRLGLETDVFVRSRPEWSTIVEENPFPEAARLDPSHLVVIALRRSPGARELRDLRASISGREEIRPGARCVYATYPDGIGRSKLTLGRVETALRSSGTARNWNTVVKLRDLARERPE